MNITMISVTTEKRSQQFSELLALANAAVSKTTVDAPKSSLTGTTIVLDFSALEVK